MPLLNDKNKSIKEKKQALKWYEVRRLISNQFGKKPDLNAILFLIGINELGFVKSFFTKEEKQDLIHVAICTLLANKKFYIYTGKDEQGWPHYKVNQSIPPLKLIEQERLLKQEIIIYFEKQNLI